jgi:hypothetical protein
MIFFYFELFLCSQLRNWAWIIYRDDYNVVHEKIQMMIIVIGLNLCIWLVCSPVCELFGSALSIEVLNSFDD